jgi:hypothetical protein
MNIHYMGPVSTQKERVLIYTYSALSVGGKKLVGGDLDGTRKGNL